MSAMLFAVVCHSSTEVKCSPTKQFCPVRALLWTIFFCIYGILGTHGGWGFEPRPKMALLRQPTAAMRPPFSNSAQKVVQGQIYGDLRTPAEHAQKLTYLNVSYGNQGLKCLRFEFFKIGPFKIKNKAIGVYPHPTRAPHATLIPTSLKVHI